MKKELEKFLKKIGAKGSEAAEDIDEKARNAVGQAKKKVKKAYESAGKPWEC